MPGLPLPPPPAQCGIACTPSRELAQCEHDRCEQAPSAPSRCEPDRCEQAPSAPGRCEPDRCELEDEPGRRRLTMSHKVPPPCALPGCGWLWPASPLDGGVNGGNGGVNG
eukprot:scaffold9835_cov81-Isochrysis_galbana.AAC.1